MTYFTFPESRFAHIVRIFNRRAGATSAKREGTEVKRSFVAAVVVVVTTGALMAPAAAQEPVPGAEDTASTGDTVLAEDVPVLIDTPVNEDFVIVGNFINAGAAPPQDQINTVTEATTTEAIATSSIPDPFGISTNATGWCNMTFTMNNDRAGSAYRTAPRAALDWYFSNGKITQSSMINDQWRSSGYRLETISRKTRSSLGQGYLQWSVSYDYVIDGYFPQWKPRRTVQLIVELTRQGNRCYAYGSWRAYS